MKNVVVILFLLSCTLNCVAQPHEFLAGVDLDSTYNIIGIGRGTHNSSDSLQRFWFFLDDPSEMKAIQKDWVLSKTVPRINFESNMFEVFVTRDHQLQNWFALVYPVQGIINVKDRWYKFDTSKLLKLHKEHPIKYRSESRSFETFQQYVAYANGILHDSALLFFFEPSLKYEGQFTITVACSNSSDNSIFVLHDINKELEALTSKENFHSANVVIDRNGNSPTNKAQIEVDCSKSLYEKYKNKSYEISEWRPSLIELKSYWKE